MAFDQTKYIEGYIKENIKHVRVSLNKRHDADIIEWLEKQGNASGYIKRLIQADMVKKPLMCCEMCDYWDRTTGDCDNMDSPCWHNPTRETYFCNFFHCTMRT